MANKKAIKLLADHLNVRSKQKGTAKGDSVPVGDPQVAKAALTYLDAFGYLAKELESWKDINLDDILKAVGQFQDFFGLKNTGELSVKTLKAMQMPRCGCPDHIRPWHREAKVREFVQNNLARWHKTSLKYVIIDYVSGLSKSDFESVIYNAFQAWTELGNISTTKIPFSGNSTSGADIIITTGRGQQDNFDGPSGVLAWAYMPNGQDQQLMMKFDLDETWVLDPSRSRGIGLLAVATHEFGHLFGLDHSREQTALMAPYYNPTVYVPKANDDIPRFQARYGTKPPVLPPTLPPMPPQQPPSGNMRSITISWPVGADVTVAMSP